MNKRRDRPTLKETIKLQETTLDELYIKYLELKAENEHLIETVKRKDKILLAYRLGKNSID